MGKQYCAIVKRESEENELTHYKYIKREKQPNGKYRYYYKTRTPRNLNEVVRDVLDYDKTEAFDQMDEIVNNQQKYQVDSSNQVYDMRTKAFRNNRSPLYKRMETTPERFIGTFSNMQVNMIEGHDRLVGHR